MKEPALILKREMVVDHVATGAMVKAYRVSLGITQDQLAAALGQDYPTIVSDLEHGKRIWTQVKMVRVLDAIKQCQSTQYKNK